MTLSVDFRDSRPGREGGRRRRMRGVFPTVADSHEMYIVHKHNNNISKMIRPGVGNSPSLR